MCSKQQGYYHSVEPTRKQLGERLREVIAEMERVQTDINMLIDWYVEFEDTGDNIRLNVQLAVGDDPVLIELPALQSIGRLGPQGFGLYELMIKQAKTYLRQLDNQRIMLAKQLAA